VPPQPKNHIKPDSLWSIKSNKSSFIAKNRGRRLRCQPSICWTERSKSNSATIAASGKPKRQSEASSASSAPSKRRAKQPPRLPAGHPRAFTIARCGAVLREGGDSARPRVCIGRVPGGRPKLAQLPTFCARRRLEKAPSCVAPLPKRRARSQLERCPLPQSLLPFAQPDATSSTAMVVAVEIAWVSWVCAGSR
jgi:hypothetical protein